MGRDYKITNTIMVPLPRTRKAILKDINELWRDASPTPEGHIAKCLLLLTEVILDKEDYPTFDDNDRAN